jgi:uncharacterized membrane protein
VVLVMGFLIRHFYNRRHAGLPNPWWAWAAAGLGMVAVVLLSWAGSREATGATAASPPSFDEAAEIVLTRCSVCHAAEPVWAGFIHAPAALRLDTPGEVAAHARQIRIYAVLSSAMPPGNVSEITADERQRLGEGLSALAVTRQAGAP